MKKIAILGLHLGYGGVEQAIVNQANMFCENYEVELVITYSLMETIPYYLNPKVKVTYLTKLKPNKEVFLKYLRQKHFGKAFLEGMKSIFILYQKKKTMKSYIKKSDADILISSRITYTKLVSRYAKNKITIAEEHCHHNGNQKYIRKLQKAMKGIDYLLPVSKELTRDYQKWIQNGRTKCLFISNSLEYWPQASSSLHKKNLISVGRISKEKGYLDLIEVFHLVHEKCPDWKLHIIGDGEEMEKLKQKIEKYHLTNSVILHGFQKKDFIYQTLLESSIYLMCSYEESFGIVLLEAASFGLPLIAFSSAQGAHEIIQNEENGYLIENRDIRSMSTCIINLISDEERRKIMGRCAKKSVEQYSFFSVKETWLTFFASLEEKQ